MFKTFVSLLSGHDRTICFSTITQILHRNKPCVFFCLSKQNSLLQPTTCVSSWKTRAKVTSARLGPNATCTSRQTALGVRRSQTAGNFETTKRAEPTSQSGTSATSNYMLMGLLFEILLATF
jgi:hypothetical protein